MPIFIIKCNNHNTHNMMIKKNDFFFIMIYLIPYLFDIHNLIMIFDDLFRNKHTCKAIDDFLILYFDMAFILEITRWPTLDTITNKYIQKLSVIDMSYKSKYNNPLYNNFYSKILNYNSCAGNINDIVNKINNILLESKKNPSISKGSLFNYERLINLEDFVINNSNGLILSNYDFNIQEFRKLVNSNLYRHIAKFITTLEYIMDRVFSRELNPWLKIRSYGKYLYKVHIPVLRYMHHISLNQIYYLFPGNENVINNYFETHLNRSIYMKDSDIMNWSELYTLSKIDGLKCEPVYHWILYKFDHRYNLIIKATLTTNMVIV
jgi:hypothetical protein